MKPGVVAADMNLIVFTLSLSSFSWTRCRPCMWLRSLTWRLLRVSNDQSSILGRSEEICWKREWILYFVFIKIFSSLDDSKHFQFYIHPVTHTFIQSELPTLTVSPCDTRFCMFSHALTPHIQFLTPKKKQIFGLGVRSFSNSPTVDSAKERICNARFTPGAEAPRRAKESQAPPIHPPVKPLCGSHGLHRWFRRWVYCLRSTRAYRARKHTEKWF